MIKKTVNAGNFGEVSALVSKALEGRGIRSYKLSQDIEFQRYYVEIGDVEKTLEFYLTYKQLREVGTSIILSFITANVQSLKNWDKPLQVQVQELKAQLNQSTKKEDRLKEALQLIKEFLND